MSSIPQQLLPLQQPPSPNIMVSSPNISSFNNPTTINTSLQQTRDILKNRKRNENDLSISKTLDNQSSVH